MIIIYEADRLNNYNFITQPYGKCKRSSDISIRYTAHKILFIVGRRTIDMSHIDGVDDGIGYGVRGISKKGNGVVGNSEELFGVSGRSISNAGVQGSSQSSAGVAGTSRTGTAVVAYGYDGDGLFAYTKSTIYYKYGMIVGSNNGNAAYLDGYVRITGSLTKAGGGFKIDHPLDSANKYLHHSFVESPDMKNVYDGVVVLDDDGEAKIQLPDWFGALNKDFRYQLTSIGAPGPNLYIAEEISEATTTNNSSSSKNNNSRFKIAGGTSGMKVSWQVTGIRKDPWANAHRIEVEEGKPDKERGYYLHPDLYSQPEENGISHLLFPKEERKKHERIINENKPNL